MSFRESFLPLIDRLRGGIPGRFDLRQFKVTLVIRRWDGERIGIGNPSDTETQLTTGGYNPKVVHVSNKDIVASGGRYTSEDLKVGPFTPAFTGGGVSADTINPPMTGQPTEILFRIEGPGMPEGGGWYRRTGDDTDSNFNYFVYVTALGVTP